MSNLSLQLDELVAVLLAEGNPSTRDPELQELLAIAAQLKALPDPDFKLRLKLELLDNAKALAEDVASRSTAQFEYPPFGRSPQRGGEIFGSLLSQQKGAYPVHRGSFVASALAHTAALVLLVTVSIFAARKPDISSRVSSSLVTDIGPYLPPVAADKTRGGGGGGDRDPLKASRGNPPRFAANQLAPPAIVVRNERPNLAAEATVVGPPNLSFPQTTQTGDPLSAVLRPLSNGPGSNSGIGGGSDGGVGIGRGRGVGLGTGGGIGGGPYIVGGRVTRPRAIYDPEPEYSEEARKAKHQGVVVLQVVIGNDGRPQDVRVVRALGMGLDEQAIEAVRQWRFEPARLDGRAVAVLVNIEVNFRLY